MGPAPFLMCVQRPEQCGACWLKQNVAFANVKPTRHALGKSGHNQTAFRPTRLMVKGCIKSGKWIAHGCHGSHQWFPKQFMEVKKIWDFWRDKKFYIGGMKFIQYGAP